MRLGVCALVALVVLLSACGGAARGPSGVARTYVEAIVDKDGARLCPLLDPATRRQIGQVIAQARSEGGVQGPLDCAHVAATLLGYPHENMKFQFTTGRLLSVGRSRRVGRYVGVDLRVTMRLVPNGSYAPLGSHAVSRHFADTVWLTNAGTGWRTVKPSRTLLAAWDGDALAGDSYERTQARDAVQPPPR